MREISGFLHDYPWGVPGGLRSWLLPGSEPDPVGPEAELWFGAHQNGPSPVLGEPGLNLRDVVDPSDVPLLVKLLAAARPLSIQIHPPSTRAADWFAEQLANPDLPKLLSDSAVKTEMLIALKPFSALAGFRDPVLAAAILHRVGGEAADAARALERDDLRAAIRGILAMPDGAARLAGDRLASAAASAGLDSAGVRALGTVARWYPGDPGVLVAALLDHVDLAPGQALYVPAGLVHSYVCGTGVEVMTASDNVLRLGLTGKTIAVEHALEAIDSGAAPEVLHPAALPLAGGGTIRRYEPARAPFAVSSLQGGSASFQSARYRLVLATSGETSVRCGQGERVVLSPGSAAVATADEGPLHVEASAAAFISEAVPPCRPGQGRE